MNDSDVQHVPRGERHGEEMNVEMEEGTHYHCHACWKYTDDTAVARQHIEAEMRTIQCACETLVNSDTLAVEKSDAFRAADQYLAAVFDAARLKLAGPPTRSPAGQGPSLSLPKFGA